MSENEISFIDYDNRVQEALRNVVREVLDLVSREGLQGEHHFYITFRTQAPGVVLPDRLIERFPDEMTIVLQHKFWELAVTEHQFSVGLSFDRQMETLVIPFNSIIGFVDPSEKFALQFQADEQADAIEGDDLSDLTEGVHDALFHAEQQLAKSVEDEVAFDAADAQESATNEDSAKGGDNVVTLDAFRKK